MATEHAVPVAADLGGELLVQARRTVEPGLRSWVGRLPVQARAWAGYHLGWLDAQGRPVTAPTGKAVRPALAFACARAVGGKAADALGPAVAVELAHAFSLVHDDIIDGDELRRHRLTVWKAFGTPVGILAGDVLLALACQVLTDPPGPRPSRSIACLCEAVVALVEGEAADVAFEQRDDVTVAEYEAMVAGKTGALMGCACALGALAGGADEARAGHLARFGRHLGVAFQIADDVLGVFGDEKATGKPVGRDLAMRKKSYPVIAALASPTASGRELSALYACPAPLSADQVRRAVQLVDGAGGRQLSARAADQQLRRSLGHLAEVDPAPGALRDLTALAHLMTHRSG